MKFGLVIKAQQSQHTYEYRENWKGFELNAEANHRLPNDVFTAADAEKVIETEQFLEKLLGFRVHIIQVLGEN